MHDNSITLTPARHEDLDALVALRIEAMRESLERIGRFDAARARERLVSGFSPAHTRHIELQHERAGFVVVKPVVDAMLLEHLYIRPQYQGRRIGSVVLARVVEEAGGCDIHVTSLRGSDSNHFYLNHGFKLAGQEEFDNYYVRPGQAS